MPKVSILLTSYNHEKYIEESITSILNQTFQDFELIIVDDHSTDSSFKIIKSFKDKRIIAIRNDKNQGPEYAFKILHQRAKGKFIAIADSDNVWAHNKLEKQVNFLEKNRDYVAVFTHVNIIDEFGHPYIGKKSLYQEIFSVKNRSRQEWLHYFFFNGNCLCHPSILIHREIYQDCNMIVNGLWQVPDLYKWIRLCLKHNLYIIKDRLVNFRVHQDNISRENNLENVLRINNEFYQIYKLFYDMNKQDFLLTFKEESTKFIVNGSINIKFTLSKLLLEHNTPAAQTLGLNKIFEMLNSDTEREQILNLYHYDAISYKIDETRLSPFALPNWSNTTPVCRAKLYLDLGNGFNEKDVITNDFIADRNGNFSIDFKNIATLSKGKKIKLMRFDPSEFSSKVKLHEVTTSGKKQKIEINQSAFSKSQYMEYDGYNIFFTNDPSYIIYKFRKPIDNLHISGKIFILKPEDVAKLKDLEISKILSKPTNIASKIQMTWKKCRKNIKKTLRTARYHFRNQN